MSAPARSRASLAAALLAAAALAGASGGGLPTAAAARVTVGLAALLGLGWWALRTWRRRPGGPTALAPRLTVVGRVSLGAATGLALVEVDGRPYLVVHGDGFARLRPAARLRAPDRRLQVVR